MVADPAHSLRLVESPQDAFEAIYLEHHDFVWRSLRALGVPASAADDLTQDVFVTVHHKLSSFDASQQMRGWIFGITRNMARRYGEKITRRRRALAVVHEPPVQDASPEQVAAAAQAVAAVERFLDTLDEPKRAVFVLCELEEATAPEAAEILGIKLNTAYSRLRTARQLFAKAVAREESRRTRRRP